MAQFDYVLVGGGLQNGLCALALRARQPDATIALVERGAVPGGNHTWCFHEGDVDPAQRGWIDPLVAHRWDGYDVAFREVQRRLSGGYAAVTSERLASVLAPALAAPGCELLCNTTATTIGAHEVVVRTPTGERRLEATAVIDARGPEATASPPGGFQKFVGLEVRTERPHGIARPMLMDATVEQVDGFRFFYLLPLAPDRLLIEDTRFADRSYLDVAELRAECLAYAVQRGWTIAAIEREEHGVLPLPCTLEVPEPGSGPLVAGIQGGWFHPTTGYSFPVAVRLATLIGELPAGELFGPALAALRTRHRRQLTTALRLNHMLFRWFPPAERHHVLARFYRLPEPTIRRFYALDLRSMDIVRIFAGRPPRGMSWRAMAANLRSHA